MQDFYFNIDNILNPTVFFPLKSHTFSLEKTGN